MAESYIDSHGDTTYVCYGICRCNVWPLAYFIFPPRHGRCGRCGEAPDLLDPNVVGSKEEARDIFYERYGHYPDPFE